VDWEIKKLGETASGEQYSFAGGPFGSDLKEDSYTESGVRVIQLQNIGDGRFLDGYKIFTSEQKADQLKKCNIYPGDIIIAKMAEPLARACMIPDTDRRFVMASDGIRLSVDESKYDKRFILNAINSTYFRNNACKHGTGTTRLRIGLTELKNLLVAMPPLNEQKRISEILATVDEAIEKTAQVIEKTREIKKGLMQQLLTRGIGHQRFKKSPVGKIPEEWEVVKLIDLAANQRYSFVDGPFGSNLKSVHYVQEGIPVIQSQSVISGKFIPEERFYISEEKARELERSRVLPGDIVIAKIVVNYGASATIPKGCPPAVLSGNTMKITPDQNKVVTTYLQYLLHYLRETKAFDRIVSTTAQPAITLEATKGLKVPLPPKEEQRKIAETLISIDRKVEKESSSKRQLESLKQGLMQVLLTGKVRPASL
jgi:type I restriction enzyme, S subunit